MALIAQGDKKRSGIHVIDGIAVIDVFGVLAHRGGYNADSTYVLGYDRIGLTIKSAIDDKAVKGILLQMDSPGGEVAGAFELAQQIKEWTAIKPIHSAISNLSASAGYLLAAATQKISITDTGVAGSIGVVMRHVDISKMAAEDGVSVTHIFAGAKKVEGNQFEPLSDSVKARFQAEVNQLHSFFIKAISQYRGLDSDAIRAQEAGVFTGQEAIKAGLADRIATPDQMLAEMQQSFQSSNTGISMSTENKDLELKAELEKSRTAGFEAGKKQGMADGVVQERKRISAILNHEAAAGREAQAKTVALETDLAPEAAVKLLESFPIAKLEVKSDQFSQHMATLGNPDVGADGDEPDPQVSVDAGWDKAFGSVVPIKRGQR
jgi:signal peptide peptidase SppA